MPDFKSLAELEKYLTQKVNNALEQEVSHVARNTLKEHVIDDVYDKYEPTQYQRHGADGGLLDDENIYTGLVDDGELVIRSTRVDEEDPSKDVAAIVEYGRGYDWTKSKIYQMQPFPRPFHRETARELDEKGLAKKALEKGLNRQGIQTE
jgi:hypothetical protein